MTAKHLFRILLIPILCLTSIQLSAQDLHRKDGDLPCINKNFNVAVHVAVDSLNKEPIILESMINTMLEETSEFFSPICVSFSACEILIIEDNYAYANLQNAPIPVAQRIDKMESLFSKERRINLFIVDSIQAIECGYGEHNGILTSNDAYVVIELQNCPDMKTSQNLAHQFGHLFGLYDTYNLDAELELVDGSNCETAGDFLCDTPADPFGKLIPIPGEPNSFYLGGLQVNCEFVFTGLDQNEDYWQPDMGNIMSAYPCKCGFTREQYMKMSEVYDQSNFKQF